jgi:hypothetical protein
MWRVSSEDRVAFIAGLCEATRRWLDEHLLAASEDDVEPGRAAGG